MTQLNYPSVQAFKRSLKKRNPWLLLLLVCSGFLVAGLVYYGLYRFLAYVGKAPILGALMGPLVGGMLVTKFLEMIYLALFFMVFFSSIIASFSAFYLDDEMKLLFSTPVSPARIFWSRFRLMVVDSSWMALAFFIPIFFAFATAANAPWFAYLLFIWLLVPYLLVPNLTGGLIALSLATFFPIRQMRKVFQFLSALVLAAMIFFFRFLEPEKLLNPNHFRDISGYILNLKNPMFDYFPSFWMREASQALFAGDLYGTMRHFTPLAVLLAVGFFILHHFARSFYKGSWQASMEAVENQVLGLEWARRVIIFPFRLFARDFRVVAEKEVTVFFRDPAIFSQIFMMGAILVVYGYNLKIIPLKDIPSLYSKEISDSLVFFNGPFIGFILSAIAMRFVFPSISLEGRAFWAVKASPIKPSRLLTIKFLLYLPCVLILALILCFISNLVFSTSSPWLTALCYLNVTLMSFVVSALAIGLGAVYASFNSENPLKIAGSFGGFVFMIFSALFVLNLLICETYPLFRLYHFRNYAYIEPKGMILIGVSFLLLLICTIAWTIIPLQKGRESIEQYEPD